MVPEAPEPEPGEDAEPAPAAASRLDDPFAVDVARAAAAMPHIRRRMTAGVAREPGATRRDASPRSKPARRQEQARRSEEEINDSNDDRSSDADDGCDQFKLYASHHTDTC